MDTKDKLLIIDSLIGHKKNALEQQALAGGQDIPLALEIQALQQYKLFLQECQIAEHYGLDNQLKKTLEEMGELQVELNRYGTMLFDKTATAAEAADVRVMATQLCYLLDGLLTERQKVKRQLERIDNGD